MNKEIPTVDEGISVTEAAKIIGKSGKGFLIVLKGGRPVGIVTENDFVKKILANEKDPSKSSIGDIMSSPLIAVDPEEDLLKAGEIMQKNNIRWLPVIKDEIIYGVIMAQDIAQHCSEYVDRSIRDVLRWTPHF
jgi:CBS domain-containing protein